MSLLTIVQEACGAIGFAVPTSAVANTADQIAQQAYRLANLAGKSLARRARWQALHKEHSFQLTEGTQEYTLPSDFGFLLANTAHNRGEQQPLILPITAQSWQYLKANGTSAAITQRARIRDDQIEFYDTIGAGQDGQTVSFEYISKHWCESSAGAGQVAFTADADVARIDEHLILLEVIWRLRHAKGLDYDMALDEFNLYLRTVIGQDGANKALSMNRADAKGFTPNFPETGYGE